MNSTDPAYPKLGAKESTAVRDAIAVLNQIRNIESPITRVHLAQTVIKTLQDAFPTLSKVDPLTWGDR